MEDEAFKVLERLVNDDDTSVEAWYLGGWCLYIVGEKLKEAKKEKNGDVEADDEFKQTWSMSRKWLATCLKLYEVQEYEDDRLGEHAIELFQNINNELGEPPEAGEEEWESASGDGDDDDEEMHG